MTGPFRDNQVGAELVLRNQGNRPGTPPGDPEGACISLLLSAGIVVGALAAFGYPGLVELLVLVPLTLAFVHATVRR